MGLPGVSQFPNATIAEQTTEPDGMGGTTTSYSYSSLADGDYVSWGLYDPDTDETIGYPDGLLRLDFPLEYQSTSSGQSSVSASYVPPGATITVQEDVEIVGWGTLVLPGGSYDALMIERVITTTTSIPGVPSQSVVNTLYSYVTREGATASAISEEPPQGGRIYVATYKEAFTQTDTEAGPLAREALLTVAPNPATQTARVEVAGLGEREEGVVYDALGRRVAAFTVAPEGRVVLQTADWAPGVYVVRVESGGRRATRRFTVLR